MSEGTFQEAMAAIIGNGLIKVQSEPGKTPKQVAADVSTAFGKFMEKHKFEIGQIVKWKPGMQHKKYQALFVWSMFWQSPLLITKANQDHHITVNRSISYSVCLIPSAIF